jgi:pseudouridine synthase
MPDSSPHIRLNKFIAQHLSVGRRQADSLIEQGRVQVDGNLPILGAQIDPAVQQVTVDGKSLTKAQATNFTYLLLNKPTGYVCSRRQQGDTPTIYRLLPQNYHHLKPVGRLDKDSSGLLLLTNDGDFTHRLTHPSFGKQKQYEITLDKPLEALHRQMISDFGITLPDGQSTLHLERLHDGDDRQWRVVMHEGRNRQIRRTFAALGYTVTRLHRIAFGAFDLAGLKPSESKEVSPT